MSNWTQINKDQHKHSVTNASVIRRAGGWSNCYKPHCKRPWAVRDARGQFLLTRNGAIRTFASSKAAKAAAAAAETAFVGPNARVCGNAWVFDNAQVTK